MQCENEKEKEEKVNLITESSGVRISDDRSYGAFQSFQNHRLRTPLQCHSHGMGNEEKQNIIGKQERKPE